MGTFLRNHAPDIAAMDLLIVLTIGFDLLYALVIIRLQRRELERDNASDGGMDCAPNNGDVPLG